MKTKTSCFAVLAMCASSVSTDAADCTPTWDGTPGQPGIAGGIVFDIAAHDDGAGSILVASGNFTSIDGAPANRIATWDGSSWSPLGTGLSNAECYAVESWGGDIYAAGYFNSAGGVPGTAKLARWDGTAWQSLGAGLESFLNQLWGLTAFDDGTGEALYITGNFVDAGGVAAADYVARWDGTSFSSVGGPIGGAVPLIVFRSYVWDDGNGDALYIGGRFLSVGGVPASRIAKWDGTSWSALGTGVTGPGVSPSVNDMVAFDDGGGEALYVCGQTFNTAGGVAANRVARWDGTAWSAVGAGFDDGIVWSLEVFDDGRGPQLYAFGTFSASDGVPMAGVARWTGSVWEAAEGGANDDTYSALTIDDVDGPAMYVAGRYSMIGGETASGIARLTSCPPGEIPGDVNGDGMVDFSDLVAALASYGACPAKGECPADFDDNGEVDFNDIVAILANWS